MTDWLQKNLMSIIIAICGIATTFVLYGYRIDSLEKDVQTNTAAIATLNIQQVQLQVQLAQIATDISYIKASLDRILKY